MVHSVTWAARRSSAGAGRSWSLAASLRRRFFSKATEIASVSLKQFPSYILQVMKVLSLKNHFQQLMFLLWSFVFLGEKTCSPSKLTFLKTKRSITRLQSAEALLTSFLNGKGLPPQTPVFQLKKMCSVVVYPSPIDVYPQNLSKSSPKTF